MTRRPLLGLPVVSVRELTAEDMARELTAEDMARFERMMKEAEERELKWLNEQFWGAKGDTDDAGGAGADEVPGAGPVDAG